MLKNLMLAVVAVLALSPISWSAEGDGKSCQFILLPNQNNSGTPIQRSARIQIVTRVRYEDPVGQPKIVDRVVHSADGKLVAMVKQDMVMQDKDGSRSMLEVESVSLPPIQWLTVRIVVGDSATGMGQLLFGIHWH